MSEMNETNKQLVPVSDNAILAEAQAMAEAADEDAGFEALLKFKKGDYVSGSDGKAVPLQSQFTAYCSNWTKCWVKFLNGELADRKMYKWDDKNIPKRVQLDEQDQSKWPLGLDGKPNDPWVYQYILPMENDDEVRLLFVTSSVGGRRAVADLCKAYARHMARTGVRAQPLISLGVTDMPTKYGGTKRPFFPIIEWREPTHMILKINPEKQLRDDLNDEIPF